MNNTIYIEYLNKKYPVNISKPKDPDFADIETAIFVECKEAWFAQERDLSDLWKLLELLPELIAEKKAERKKDIINLRITREEKSKIEALAKMKWYKNISSYIRERALQK